MTRELVNICIVGNIASGKSTLTELLGAGIPDSIAIPESFEQNPFLPLYLREPARWAFTSTTRYCYDYLRVYQERAAGRSCAHRFFDAGAASNRYVYARYLCEEGLMTPDESDFYNTLCDVLQRAYGYPEPDGYIFLGAEPEILFRRMMARGWQYQTANVRPEYVVRLARVFRMFEDTVQDKGIPSLDLDTEAVDLTSAAGRVEALGRVTAWLGARGRAGG